MRILLSFLFVLILAPLLILLSSCAIFERPMTTEELDVYCEKPMIILPYNSPVWECQDVIVSDSFLPRDGETPRTVIGVSCVSDDLEYDMISISVSSVVSVLPKIGCMPRDDAEVGDE